MATEIDENIQVWFNAAVDTAKQAGEMMKDAWTKEKVIDTKSCSTDLVTETDQKVEKFIISTFKSKFPSHKFIGEESVAAGIKSELTDCPTWIIDPVDGTTNFVHRFPFSCISIGLAVEKKIVVGVVFNPISGECFSAKLGQGAYCNGVKLEATKTTDLTEALCLCEFGSSRSPEVLALKFKTMNKIIDKVHGVRSLGSCALNMSYVAAGWADMYHQQGIHVWDLAAGLLLVREAGGVVCDTAGGELDMMARRVLCAGTPQLAQQLSQIVEPIPDLARD